jgi:hypothetical protein
MVVVLALALAGTLLAGSVVAAQRGGNPPDAAKVEAAIAAARMIRVADVAGGEGFARRGVFIQELDTGDLCVWDAASASSPDRQGGCNSIDEPLGGSAISANLAYDGGPAIESVRDARLSGLTSSSAASVVVLMSDGSERTLRLKPVHLEAGDFAAFGYRFKKSDFRSGVGPIAVIARATGGKELGRQATGIGG